jgi:Ca-activated chloride channel family protein
MEASLDAPPTAQIGATLEIHWTGPGNNYDQIALFASDAGADAKPIKVERILAKKNPLPLRLPEVAGDYELR